MAADIDGLLKTFTQLKEKSFNQFPKTCSNCERTFHTIEEFMNHTHLASDHSGVLGELNHPDRTIVDFWRACTCGSTMMVVGEERRNQSFQGNKARKYMGLCLDQLMGDDGLCYEDAKAQVLSWVDDPNPVLPKSHRNLEPHLNRLRILLAKESPAGTRG